MNLLTLDSIQRLDDLIINLVGLRVDLNLLPDALVAEILIRARKDLDFVIRGYRDEIEK